MNENSKLLTISIPTWNRAILLNELLAELTEQVSSFQLEKEIEILVSNNASEDDTEDVVKTFQQKISFLNYNRNGTNIGAKSNVLKSMELASSEFVMVVGDDDRIRKNVLPELLQILKTKKDLGVLIDVNKAKKVLSFEVDLGGTGKLSLEELLKNYYWYMGNAGIFVTRTSFIKENLSRYGSDFFNECWPQTQLMVLGLQQNPNLSAYIKDLCIPAESLHEQVMVYNSYYLWRTCYYDLTISINALKNLVNEKVINAAKCYLKKNIVQQLFNILQCGVFTDEKEIKRKTREHIFQNLNLFSSYEKNFLWLIIITLSIPSFISKPMSNLFIFILKGKAGIKKKNDFVRNEKMKKEKMLQEKIAVRKLEFERQ